MLCLYNWSNKLYAKYFKKNKTAWGLNVEDFKLFPVDSLGYSLGIFYSSNGFNVMPKLENHDVFHVITQTGTAIHEEIAMQYLLMGNGKCSLYMYAMIIIGTVIYPEFIRYYMFSYQKGKSLNTFHHIEFFERLKEPLKEIQWELFVKKNNHTI